MVFLVEHNKLVLKFNWKTKISANSQEKFQTEQQGNLPKTSKFTKASESSVVLLQR